MSEMETQAGASRADQIVVLNQIARNLAILVQTMSAVLPRINGTFTLSAAATTTVTQPSIKANSLVQPFPTNTSAAVLQGSARYVFVSSLIPGSGFLMRTANGSAAGGTETFNYTVINPA